MHRNFLFLILLFPILQSCTQKKVNWQTINYDGLQLAKMSTQKWMENSAKRTQSFQQYKDSHGDTLKLKKIIAVDEKRARKIVKNNNFLLAQMYEVQPTPYPGVISKEQSCSKDQKPKFVRNKSKNSWSVSTQISANELFVPQICDPEQKIANAQYLWLYCQKQKNLYILKYYAPNRSLTKNLNILDKNVSCTH